LRAAKLLVFNHGAGKTPEGRALRLLREWLSPEERDLLARKGHFEVVGGETGARYRIHVGTSMNVCQLDHRGKPLVGLCFLPVGNLEMGDVMLAQKIAIENRESVVMAVAHRFTPKGHLFRPGRPFP
jgi:hypothetical protein